MEIRNLHAITTYQFRIGKHLSACNRPKHQVFPLILTSNTVSETHGTIHHTHGTYTCDVLNVTLSNSSLHCTKGPILFRHSNKSDKEQSTKGTMSDYGMQQGRTGVHSETSQS